MQARNALKLLGQPRPASSRPARPPFSLSRPDIVRAVLDELAGLQRPAAGLRTVSWRWLHRRRPGGQRLGEIYAQPS